MIEVLYISDSLRQRFGVTSVIMNYLENMPKDRVKVDLLVYENSEAEQVYRAKSYGSSVYYMPELGLNNLVLFRKFMNRFFEEHHYSIVHSHFNQIDGIVFPIARRHGVQYCISHSHNTRLSDSRIKALRNRLLCWNIGWNGDYLAACSEAAGISLYGRRFKNSDKKLLIHNGIAVERFGFCIQDRDKIRSEFNVNDDEVLIGHIGSFKPQKNHSFLIEIFAGLCKKSVKYKLMLVGDGDKRSVIQDKVKEYGIEDKVIFAGVRSDINHILSALDLFVLPSLYEGLGIVLIEAQSSGLMCFASDKVPDDARVSSNIEYLKIDNGIDNWVKKIFEAKPVNVKHRKGCMKIVSDNGYNIKEQALLLENFYVSLIKE